MTLYLFIDETKIHIVPCFWFKNPPLLL